MAFCKQCGTNLNEAKFCPNCGAAADGEIVAQQKQAVSAVNSDIRRQSLAEMSDMLKYFGTKKDQYDKLDVVNKKVEKLSSKSYTGWLICGVLFTLIGFWIFKHSSGLFVARILFSFFIPALCFAAFVLFRKKNIKKLNAATQEQMELCEELADHYAAYGYCPLGIEYTNPAVLALINDVIRQGKASTPEDALNRLVEELHNAKMEKEAEITAAAAIATAEHTKQAAKSARKAAGYAAADFWLK